LSLSFLLLSSINPVISRVTREHSSYAIHCTHLLGATHSNSLVSNYLLYHQCSRRGGRTRWAHEHTCRRTNKPRKESNQSSLPKIPLATSQRSLDHLSKAFDYATPSALYAVPSYRITTRRDSGVISIRTAFSPISHKFKRNQTLQFTLRPEY